MDTSDPLALHLLNNSSVIKGKEKTPVFSPVGILFYFYIYSIYSDFRESDATRNKTDLISFRVLFVCLFRVLE